MDRKKYFDAYPNINQFHFTSDGLAFTKKEIAESHQKTLRKGMVETVDKKNVGKNANTKETKIK